MDLTLAWVWYGSLWKKIGHERPCASGWMRQQLTVVRTDITFAYFTRCVQAAHTDSVSPKAAIEAQKYRDHLQLASQMWYHHHHYHYHHPKYMSLFSRTFTPKSCRLSQQTRSGKTIASRYKPNWTVSQSADWTIRDSELKLCISGNVTSKRSIRYRWRMGHELTAKSFVKQAETEVTVNMPTAYPLAHVCVLLFRRHPTFLDSLMARFVKCTYVIPYMDKQLYSERMCGILALWAVILQMTPEESRMAGHG
ncbi:GLE1-like protein-domain-containing protein [Jimgerdemannia flammicorona]|uniref:mRNA export factor GLE1 n=1 Tax=Jimgerdemannia flammicorona TaxID=994334 RepID=A0A433BAE9_9FUNG|nr:GLE1-like protein-domain-containing protein [Jimgerdemannia flammicorona]